MGKTPAVAAPWPKPALEGHSSVYRRSACKSPAESGGRACIWLPHFLVPVLFGEWRMGPCVPKHTHQLWGAHSWPDCVLFDTLTPRKGANGLYRKKWISGMLPVRYHLLPYSTVSPCQPLSPACPLTSAQLQEFKFTVLSCQLNTHFCNPLTWKRP